MINPKCRWCGRPIVWVERKVPMATHVPLRFRLGCWRHEDDSPIGSCDGQWIEP